MLFEDFGLDPRCLKVLSNKGITEPTPIQEQSMPPALEGRDVVGVAQTGTGKTLAYCLPSFTRMCAGPERRNMMLVLVPTRELCVQVHRVAQEVGRPLHLHSVSVYGGVSIDGQAKELRKGANIIVATPGRLLDHMGRRNVRFDDLEIFVLDEADRMLDMGFLPDIQRIMRKLPQKRQTLMFSATFPDEIARLSERMLNEPVRVAIGEMTKPVDTVRQTLYAVKPEHKTRLLLKILDESEVASALIFLRTKSRTERLAHTMRRKGLSIAQIHGDRSQRQREQALDGFREGRYKFLVATDVAARGLDIDGVSHVFNYDIPPNADDYIHRIGRTARAHAEGDAITFVSPPEFNELASIERALGHHIPREEWEDAPPILSLFKANGSKGKVNRGMRRRGARRLLRRR